MKYRLFWCESWRQATVGSWNGDGWRAHSVGVRWGYWPCNRNHTCNTNLRSVQINIAGSHRCHCNRMNGVQKRYTNQILITSCTKIAKNGRLIIYIKHINLFRNWKQADTWCSYYACYRYATTVIRAHILLLGCSIAFGCSVRTSVYFFCSFGTAMVGRFAFVSYKVPRKNLFTK